MLLPVLALAQLRRSPGRWALLVLGVLLVVAIPVATEGLSRHVAAATVRRTVAHLGTVDGTLLVNREASAARPQGGAAMDASVRRELATITGRPIVRELLFRPVIVRGTSLLLGGADALGAVTRPVSGRLPRSCTPTRCEVVAVTSAGARLAPATVQAAATLGVVVVGEVQRRSPVLVTGQLAPGSSALLLTDGADAMARLDALSLYSRQYVWAAPVDADRIVDLGVATYARRITDIDDELDRQVGGASLYAPTDALQAAADRADTSAHRLALLAGFAAVLLIGFAVVVGTGLRREAELLVTVLARRGATRRQTVVLTVLQAVAGCLAGALLGCIAGAVLAAAGSSGTGASPVRAGVDAVGSAAVSVLALTAATVVALAAVLLWPDAEARALRRSLDLLTVACLGAVLLAADRGSATAGDLTSGQDPLVAALPVLASVVAGLVAIRLWGPAVGLVQRALPRGSVAGRIGLVGILRRPLRPLATTAFVTAAVASVVFAGAYRATLLANDADQAAYRVPLDATLGASPGVLVPHVTAGQFGPGVGVYGVVRTHASVTRLAGVVDSIPLIAPDAAALLRVHRWSRTSGADLSPAALSRRLQVAAPAAPTLPATARTIAVAAAGVDPQTSLGLYLRWPDGTQARVDLTRRGGALVGSLPHASRGAPGVVAISVDQSFDRAGRRAHNLGEGSGSLPLLTGTLRLGAVEVDGQPLAWSWAGWGSANGRTTATRGALSLSYRIADTPAVAVDHYSAGTALPVAVDASTARDARGGVVTLVLDAATTLTARIVAVLPRLPTVDGPFVLADRRALLTAMDRYEPGRNADAYWVAGSSARLDRALASSPLTVTRRSAVQHDLDTDPVAEGARELLVLVALLALGVAAAALVVLVLGERRDGAGEFYAWEADGTAPRTLRRVLVVRALAVAAVSVPVGVVAGIVVAHAGATLVAVDAGGRRPVPALQVSLGSAPTIGALALGLGAGLAVACGVALAALRERLPVPGRADLR